MKTPVLPQPNSLDLSQAFGDTNTLIAELKRLKIDLVKTLNGKLQEIDAKIAEHTQMVEETTSQAISTVNKANDTVEQIKTEAIDLIKERAIQGQPGTPADEEKIAQRLELKIPTPVDIEQLKKDILSQIPTVDEKKLVKKFLKAIPQDKASLKIIQEKVEIDPMSVIEKIMELSKQGKFKLKKENIDGLEQTMSAFQNQLGRGYLHGGGDTVSAGTNITITTNSAGQKVISSTGGTINFATNEVVAGSVNTFTLANTPTVGSVTVYANGQLLTPTDGILPNDYSISGKIITTVSTWNAGNILANYRY